LWNWISALVSDLTITKPSSRIVEKRTFTVDWVNVFGIAFYHLVALLAVFPYFFSWTGVILVILGNFVFGMVGIGVFYHRFLTHKGFQCKKWLEYVMAILAICCFQETPARWVAAHRRHHEHSDDEFDPHTPVQGFLWAHIGWILVKSPEMSRYELYGRYVKDVLRDPFYRKLEDQRYYLGIIFVQFFLFFAAGAVIVFLNGGTSSEIVRFGISILVWGVFVRTVFVWHVTWSVNSITHMWGYRNYETGENSRNNILIGLLANGEGWHNNHHADPGSASNWHRWWEIDLTYLTIRLLAQMGLAWRITEPRVRPKDNGTITRSSRNNLD
jgi:fatty-acid desaturase